MKGNSFERIQYVEIPEKNSPYPDTELVTEDSTDNSGLVSPSEPNSSEDSSLWLLLVLFIVSGVFMPLLIVSINHNGGANPITFLPALPSSLAMCLGRFINPVPTEKGKVEWVLIVVIAILETGSQALILDGLMLAGSAIYTVAYSSVLIYNAIFSRYLIGRNLNTLQWIGILTVMLGLALTSSGAKADGREVLLGFSFVLLGSLTHALTYVGSEYLLTITEDPIRPEYLSFLLGGVGTSLNLAWQCLYTIPNAQTVVVENIQLHNGSVKIILLSYLCLFLCAAVHSFCFYYLLCRVGSVTTGLCKGAQSVLVFVASHFIFCSEEKAQCFTIPKGISLVIVLIGVLIYSFYTSEDHPHHHHHPVENRTLAEKPDLENFQYQPS
jgi:drug/metabolite transporter (DMT)-like permease